MILKNANVKVYRSSSPLFSMAMLMSMPRSIHPQSMVIAGGEMPYLFRGDQIEMATSLASQLSGLITDLRHWSHRCGFVDELLESCDKPLFRILKTLLTPPKKIHMRCLSCPLCKKIELFKRSSGLSGNSDIPRLRYIVSPQALPPGMLDIGDSQYRIEPFSINIIDDVCPIYIPLLDKMSVEERADVYDFSEKIKALEWRALRGPISLVLNEIIEKRKGIARDLGTPERLIPITVYLSVGLANLFPLLLDDGVSEIFVDKESSYAYIDHRDYGRCTTAVYVKKNDIQHLLTFARMASGKVIDYLSPSLRSSIKTSEFYVRVSADAPPRWPWVAPPCQ
jgi:hypothetical protein